jgi:hypothetical protein
MSEVICQQRCRIARYEKRKELRNSSGTEISVDSQCIALDFRLQIVRNELF